MMPRKPHIAVNPLLSIALVALGASACSQSEAAGQAAATDEVAPARALVDEALEPHRRELLELAYEAASAYPLNPHVKSRSRSQESVIATWIDLRQAARALASIDGIENWRRGAAYADLAFWCARNDRDDHVQELLAKAGEVAEWGEERLGQAWRRDRILTKIACSHVWLGDLVEAARLEDGSSPGENERVLAVRASLVDRSDYEAAVASLDDIVDGGTFEDIKGALTAYTELYDRFYGNEERREQLVGRVHAAWVKLPGTVRLDVLMELADRALQHEDAKEALRNIDEARSMLGGFGLDAENHIPYAARLAALSFRAGDTSAARQEAGAALERFIAERETIVDVFRGATLRPLAEAFVTFGDLADAHGVYMRILDEAQVNPNSRPRADDLVATCVSLARSDFEPSADLMGRLRAMAGSLGEPW